MEKILGFANYGVTAHEKKILFTVGDIPADCPVSDRVEFDLPEGWTTERGGFNNLLLVSPDGDVHNSSDILRSYDDKPCLHWFNGAKNHIYLKWREI